MRLRDRLSQFEGGLDLNEEKLWDSFVSQMPSRPSLDLPQALAALCLPIETSRVDVFTLRELLPNISYQH